ncbi:unknown protein [Azorhizobium caulinodans ORS 571]|uniref:Uncharacterized protein n=1 Tax=Azorhizobium caulinodans (strain ATCC 43989 / DSM 5975 / JCM 20966 / LMG 6465 / NBRC 14845 / NCIMB 13405 / ORS 571) TaxID=438753 RepID=A8IDE2_AZOC5|nr:unknown protein [Azorhizobium caulinodans ORS 571]
MSLPEIEADVIEALTELALQHGHIERPPEKAVGGDQAGAAGRPCIAAQAAACDPRR